MYFFIGSQIAFPEDLLTVVDNRRTMGMTITVIWDVALCSLVEIDRRFRGAYYLRDSPNDGDSKHP
jgi:hypothetical protein